jgi:tetratricopeptide (TPR) repeat protein
LSSVIRALGNDLALARSTAIARAQVMRAELYLELGLPNMVDEALQDCQQAVDILRQNLELSECNNGRISSLVARALRLQSDSYVRMDNYASAILALQEACRVHPLAHSKLTAEINRLQQQHEMVSAKKTTLEGT